MLSDLHLVNVVPGSGVQDVQHPPLGLLYVGSYLVRNGYSVAIHQILPKEIDSLTDGIVKDDPLLVGFSVTTGLSSYYSASMSKLLKSKNSEATIVWGGWHPSLTPEQCLAEDYVDIVCVGEGERTLLEVAEALKAKRNLSEVKSIGFKSQSKPVMTAPRPPEANIDVFELDYGLLDFGKFTIRRGDTYTTSFSSSRGCVHICGFCCTPSMFKRKWRPHSPEYVVRHLAELKHRFGVNDVYFSDDNFFADHERAFAIIKGLRDAGISCSTVDVRVDSINKGMLERLVRYGATGAFFGWESGSDRLLSLMRKNITTDQIISCARLMSEFPVSVWASGIMCLPTETRAEFDSTLKMALALFKAIPQGTVSLFPYMPLPGTEFLRLAVENGFKTPVDPEDWVRSDPQSPFYDVTWIPWIGEAPARMRNIRMTQEFTRKVLARTGPSSNWAFSAVQTVFNKLGCYRISRQNFSMPIDLKMHSLFKGCWQTARTLF